jgi:hypothetical protein
MRVSPGFDRPVVWSRMIISNVNDRSAQLSSYVKDIVIRVDLWGSITYGQNLEPQGVEPAQINRDVAFEFCFHQNELMAIERQG